jgi:hypothetical protein
VKQMCSWPRGVNYGKKDKNGHWGKDYCIFPSAELFTPVNRHYRKIFELGANIYGISPLAMVYRYCVLWRNVEKTAGKISPTKVL